VYKWAATFKIGRTNVTDEERSGHPSTSTAEEDTKRFRAVITGNERVTFDEVEHVLCMSHGPAHGIIQGQAGFNKSVKMGSKTTSNNAQAQLFAKA
jgi:hypothetical protein